MCLLANVDEELLQILLWGQCSLLQGLVKVLVSFFQERDMSHAGTVQ